MFQFSFLQYIKNISPLLIYKDLTSMQRDQTLYKTQSQFPTPKPSFV